MRSPFTIGGWIGFVLFVIGIVLLILGALSSPSVLELAGTISSVCGFIWMLLDRMTNAMDIRLLRVENTLRGIEKAIRGHSELLKEIRDMLGRGKRK